MNTIVRVWKIGSDGTEYYAAHSELEMRKYYKELMGSNSEAEDDLKNYFEEIPQPDLDTPFKFNDDGKIEMTTWRKLIRKCQTLPAQISTGYN